MKNRSRHAAAARMLKIQNKRLGRANMVGDMRLNYFPMANIISRPRSIINYCSGRHGKITQTIKRFNGMDRA